MQRQRDDLDIGVRAGALLFPPPKIRCRSVWVAALPGDLSYQDLIALTRAIADRRDTLGFGAFIRGPLVGLTEEEIADAIAALPAPEDGYPPRLHLRTDRGAIAVYPPPA
jgi:hypothetical protein